MKSMITRMLAGVALAGSVTLLAVAPAQADVYKEFTGEGVHVNADTAYDMAQKAARDAAVAAQCAPMNNYQMTGFTAPGNRQGYRATVGAWC